MENDMISTKSTQELVSWIKGKVTKNEKVTVKYIEPGDHNVFTGTLVGWNDQSWKIKCHLDMIGEDWDKETKIDFILHPCSVMIDDPRQLVNIVDDEHGNALLSRAISDYCLEHKVDR
jgi:hypothetical protein